MDRSPSRAWLVVPVALAAGALVAAGVGTETWAGIFEHEARTGMVGEVAVATQRGAVWWRGMLAVAAVALLVLPWLADRLGPDAPAERPADPPRRGAMLLAGLVVLALALRVPRLFESLWYDEIAAWRDYGSAGAGAIVANYFDPANHVFHTLLTWCSMSALVDVVGAELALRTPALLASLALIPVMGALGRHLLGARGGAIAAGLAAIWPVCVLEVEARGYGLMMLSAAASSLILLRQRDATRPWAWLVYAIVVALGIWAHPVTVAVALGHGLWLVLGLRRAASRRFAGAGLLTLGLAAVLTITLYAPALPDILVTRRMFASSTATPGLVGPEGLATLLQLGGAWSWWAVPGLLAGGLGARRLARSADGRAAIVVALAGLPIFVAIIALAGSWMYARFALFAMPGAMLLAAAGVDDLARRGRGPFLASAVVLFAAALGDLTTRPAKQPLRDAMLALRGFTDPSRPVVVIALRHEVLDVYAGPFDLVYSLDHGRDLESRLRAETPDWVVLYYPASVSRDTYDVLEAHGFARHVAFPGWVDQGNGGVDLWTRLRP